MNPRPVHVRALTRVSCGRANPPPLMLCLARRDARPSPSDARLIEVRQEKPSNQRTFISDANHQRTLHDGFSKLISYRLPPLILLLRLLLSFRSPAASRPLEAGFVSVMAPRSSNLSSITSRSLVRLPVDSRSRRDPPRDDTADLTSTFPYSRSPTSLYGLRGRAGMRLPSPLSSYSRGVRS